MLELLQTIFNPKTIALIGVFSVPTSIIWATYKYKVEQLRLKNNNEYLKSSDMVLLHTTATQNKQLEERIKNLETIITSLDSNIHTLKTPDDSERIRQIVSKGLV